MKHGAFGRGIPEIAEHTGVSPRTVIRASKDVRERNLPRIPNERSALLWRVKRGQKGEGVTVWNVGHAMVNAIWAAREKGRQRRQAEQRRKAERAQLDAALRDTLPRNGSTGQCDTTSLVAAPGGPEGGEGGMVRAIGGPVQAGDAKDLLLEPDIAPISAVTGQCEHGRSVRACLACARSESFFSGLAPAGR